MIHFYRDENKVKIKIEHGIFGTNEYFETEIQQDFPYQAELLTLQLRENLNSKLAEIKREAYNQGWKDAKARTRKRKWDEFCGRWKFY